MAKELGDGGRTVGGDRRFSGRLLPKRTHPVCKASFMIKLYRKPGASGTGAAGSSQKSLRAFITGLPPIAVFLPGISRPVCPAFRPRRIGRIVLRRSFTKDIEPVTTIENSGPILIAHPLVGSLD